MRRNVSRRNKMKISISTVIIGTCVFLISGCASVYKVDSSTRGGRVYLISTPTSHARMIGKTPCEYYIGDDWAVRGAKVYVLWEDGSKSKTKHVQRAAFPPIPFISSLFCISVSQNSYSITTNYQLNTTKT